tara:strand:- start:466 stop:1239 length:774 start_codon:yes stop_codon:yes gene_type:complete
MNIEKNSSDITFTEGQIKLLKSSCNMADASDDEFKLFFHICKRTGLDPFARQIYSIKRGNKRTIQVAIDGFRLIAERSGNYAGSSKATYTQSNGNPFDESKNQPPAKAEVTVQKIVQGHVCNFTAEARWNEYNATSNSMWKRMPTTMLGKCAESLALRKAFPADLSGLYTDDEMHQADEKDKIKGKPKGKSSFDDDYLNALGFFCNKKMAEGIENPIHIILDKFNLDINDSRTNKETLLSLNKDFKIEVKKWLDKEI